MVSIRQTKPSVDLVPTIYRYHVNVWTVVSLAMNYCSRNIMDQLIVYDNCATVIIKWYEKNRQINSLFIFYS